MLKFCMRALFPVLLIVSFGSGPTEATLWEEIDKFQQLKRFVDDKETKLQILKLFCIKFDLLPTAVDTSAEATNYKLLLSLNSNPAIRLYDVQFQVPFPAQKFQNSYSHALTYFSAIISARERWERTQGEAPSADEADYSNFTLYDVQYTKQSSFLHIFSHLLNAAIAPDYIDCRKLALESLHDPKQTDKSSHIVGQSNEIETLKKAQEAIQKSETNVTMDEFKIMLVGNSVDGKNVVKADVYVVIYEYMCGRLHKSGGAMFQVKHTTCWRLASVNCDVPIAASTKEAGALPPLPLVWSTVDGRLDELRSLRSWNEEESAHLASQNLIVKMATDADRKIDFFAVQFDTNGFGWAKEILKAKLSAEGSKSLLIATVSGDGQKLQFIRASLVSNTSNTVFTMLEEAFRYTTSPKLD